jgi:hypothetical protein
MLVLFLFSIFSIFFFINLQKILNFFYILCLEKIKNVADNQKKVFFEKVSIDIYKIKQEINVKLNNFLILISSCFLFY